MIFTICRANLRIEFICHGHIEPCFFKAQIHATCTCKQRDQIQFLFHFILLWREPVARGFRYRKRRAPSPVLCRSPWRGSIGIQEEGTRPVHRCTSARPRNHAVPILNTAKYFGRTPCLRKRKNQLMRSGVGLGYGGFHLLMKRKGFRFSAASSRPMSSGLAPERRYYSKKSARGVRYLAPALQSNTCPGRSSRRRPKRDTGVCGPSGSLSVIRGSMKRSRPESASRTVLRPGFRNR